MMTISSQFTRFLRFMMMALAVVMLLGATPTTAKAGPIADFWEDRKEDMKEEGKEWANKEAEKRTGYTLDEGFDTVMFVPHSKEFFSELKFLKVFSYTQRGRTVLSGLLLALLLVFFKRREDGYNDKAPFQIIKALIGALLVGSAFECCSSYPPLAVMEHVGYAYTAGACAPLLAFIYRYDLIVDLRASAQRKEIAYFFKHLQQSEQPEEEGEGGEGEAAEAETETGSATDEVEASDVNAEASSEPVAVATAPNCSVCKAKLFTAEDRFCGNCGFVLSSRGTTPPSTTQKGEDSSLFN